MFLLHYVGDLAVISPKGVSFDPGNPDKYNYIRPLIALVDALCDEAKWQNNTVKVSYSCSTLDDKSLTAHLLAQYEELEVLLLEETSRYRFVLDEQIENLIYSKRFCEEDRAAYARNLQVMQHYREDRHLNKVVYHYLMSRLIQRLTQKRIGQISVPFSKEYHHILLSIQSELMARRITVTSDIHYELYNGHGILKLAL